MVIQMPESAVELVSPDVSLLPKLAARTSTTDHSMQTSKSEADIHQLNSKVSWLVNKLFTVILFFQVVIQQKL
jgi:hypothetical protein